MASCGENRKSTALTVWTLRRFTRRANSYNYKNKSLSICLHFVTSVIVLEWAKNSIIWDSFHEKVTRNVWLIKNSELTAS